MPGAALVRLGRLDEGIASLNEALRLQPDNAWARHALGIARHVEHHVPFVGSARLYINPDGSP